MTCSNPRILERIRLRMGAQLIEITWAALTAHES